MKLTVSVYLLAVSLGALAVTASAQSATATLSGLVVDETNAVLTDVSVSLLAKETGFQREGATDHEGQFAFPALQPGRYLVRATRQGFTPVEVPEVTLNVNDNVSIRLQLKVQAVGEQITVSVEPPRISTSPAVSTVIDRQFVENLPMNGRSFQSLILLTPGAVTNSPQSSAAVGYSGELGVNGQRTESNRYTVDGVSANNGTYIYGYQTAGTTGALPSGTAMGTTQSLVSLDALEEFRSTSSTYSAEHGRSPGGQISFITRSGTNDWHGSAFNYFRDDALDANDWFNNRLGVAKPEQRQNNFGGTVGGPLTIPGLYRGRDRTFFFASYEGLRLQQPQAAQVRYVPSLTLRQQAHPALKPWLNAYPLPTGADLPNGLSEYVVTASLPSRVDSTSVRADHYLGQSRLFFRYSNTPSETQARSLNELTTKRLAPQSYTFGATSLIAGRVSHDFRVGYGYNTGRSWESPYTADGAQPVDMFELQGIDRAANPTAFIYAGLYFPGQETTVGVSSGGLQEQRQWNVNDTFTVALGRHQLKFGFDYLTTRSTLQRTNPYVYSLFYDRDEVIDNVARSASVVLFGRSYPVFTNYAAFVQDEWRLTQRLTLSLGLRWDVSPAASVSDGVLPYVLAGDVSQPSTLSLAAQGTPMWETTYRNFAPRLGASYVLREDDRYQTVVRGGGGLYFDTAQNMRNRTFDSSPGITYTKSYPGSSYPLTPEQLNVSLESSLVPPYSTLYQFGPNLQLPYTLQWNASVEQGLGRPQSITVSYVGARGRRLLSETQVNLAAFNPSFTYGYLVRNLLTSEYDSLQMQFQRRLSRGLQSIASYTWSNAVDYGSRNQSLPEKRGDADFDVRHSFNAALTYQIPIALRNPVAGGLLNGWSIDSRIMVRSAFPVTLSGRSLTDPSTGQQYYGGLDLVPGQPLYIERSDLPGGRQINPAAFALPVGSQVGNAPRNLARGFGASQVDLSVRRDFQLQPIRLQLRLEAFNVFNAANFGFVNATYGNPLFGQATKMLNSSLGGLSAQYQQGGPRSMQLSVKVVF